MNEQLSVPQKLGGASIVTITSAYLTQQNIPMLLGMK